jgi:hypothetical protein
VYRRDGWQGLLLPCLLQLRDACQRLKLQRDVLLTTLELACLPGASLEPGAAAAAVAALAAGGGDKKSSIMKAPEGAAGEAQRHGPAGGLRYTLQHLDAAAAAAQEEGGAKAHVADILLRCVTAWGGATSGAAGDRSALPPC